ncbi:hypothetical protein VNO77_34236 [Canavalia gladiata]|uniref:Uncharacterized protein n=1 Tax=Canavalia gladiata TaxID=3824 RepID=A0AAN9KH74_CANGL
MIEASKHHLDFIVARLCPLALIHKICIIYFFLYYASYAYLFVSQCMLMATLPDCALIPQEGEARHFFPVEFLSL